MCITGPRDLRGKWGLRTDLIGNEGTVEVFCLICGGTINGYSKQ